MFKINYAIAFNGISVKASSMYHICKEKQVKLSYPTLNTYRTAVSPTLDLLCHEDFNVGRSEAESNIEIFMAQ